MIKVSVIIPVFNVQNYLRQCLDSLVNQTLKDIEIICINDCSTDGSLAILKDYAANDERIVIVDNENNIGAAQSRNMGIQIAKGKYLSILDSDDFCDPSFLETVYQRCSSENADLGIYDFAKYDNVSKRVTHYQTSLYFSYLLRDKVFGFERINEQAFQIWSCAPYTKMYKRSFVLDCGIEFQDLKNANDVYFGYVILTQARKMIYIESASPLYFYRVNVSTQTSNNRAKHPRCTWEALMAIRKTLMEKGVFESCSRSFHSNAVSSLMYSLHCIDDEHRKALYNFLYFEGLEKLGMTNCSEENFISRYEFMRYECLRSGDFQKISDRHMAASMYVGNPETGTLFEFLKSRGYRCGLWGVGLFGMAFYNACETFDFSLSCIIDEDIGKADTQIDKYVVRPFNRSKDEIDAVIVTNTHFSKEIFNIIKRTNREIKLIDADAFCRLGLPIDECVFEAVD
jgi:Glycosyltransferases involved in cell wall biogenesis